MKVRKNPLDDGFGGYHDDGDDEHDNTAIDEHIDAAVALQTSHETGAPQYCCSTRRRNGSQLGHAHKDISKGYAMLTLSFSPSS